MQLLLRIPRLIALIFSVSGLIVLIVGAVVAVRTRSFVRHAQLADARVIASEARTDSDGTVHYFPTYSFRVGGRSIVVQSSMGSNPPSFAVGESLKVMYDPAAPEAARIDTFWQLWFVPVCLAFIGFAHLLVAGGLWFLYRWLRSRRRDDGNITAVRA